MLALSVVPSSELPGIESAQVVVQVAPVNEVVDCAAAKPAATEPLHDTEDVEMQRQKQMDDTATDPEDEEHAREVEFQRQKLQLYRDLLVHTQRQNCDSTCDIAGCRLHVAGKCEACGKGLCARHVERRHMGRRGVQHLCAECKQRRDGQGLVANLIILGMLVGFMVWVSTMVSTL